jgi:hypothetical protein
VGTCKGTKKWNFENPKKVPYDDLKILALFLDLQNSTFKDSKMASKVFFFWGAVSVPISVKRLGGKNGSTSHGNGQ